MDSENNLQNVEAKPAKKRSVWRYVVYMSIVLVVTAIVFIINISSTGLSEMIEIFKEADVLMVLLIVVLMVLSYFFDALIIFIFARLYTRTYKMHQAVANTLVGQFYNDVTPGASGGQVMQVYTMKSQGVPVSSAASIFVMWFIVYQGTLVAFDVVAILFEWDQIASLAPISGSIGSWSFSIPMVWLIIIGFFLNISVILGLLFMSYSHKFHNFILHYVLGFLGKIRVLKNVDKSRESLRAQVENFKIELRRLQANIPIVVVQIILFFFVIFIRNSIPYFSGLALHAFDTYWTDSFFDATTQTSTTIYTFAEAGTFSFSTLFEVTFLSAFHQMVVGIIGFIPGNVGTSEIIYNRLFYNLYNFDNARNPTLAITSTQILWRTATFYVPLLVSGIVAAFYHSRAKEPVPFASRQTFVTVQMETYEERKLTADTMFETSQLSRKKIQRRLLQHRKNDEVNIEQTDEDLLDYQAKHLGEGDAPKKPKKGKTKKVKSEPIVVEKETKRGKKKKKDDDSSWDSYEL